MRYLGVDFGIKRMGLAISEGELASPWRVIEGIGPKFLLQVLKKEALNFDKIIIGLPEGKMGEVVMKVIVDLEENGFNVEAADETLSSQKASKEMVELNVPKKKRRINDATAASIILQDYLDNQ